MTTRQVVIRRGRHFGWWVEGRKASGTLFMLTWWPVEGMARTVGRWFGGGVDPKAEGSLPSDEAS
jgi:hypothetical protein